MISLKSLSEASLLKKTLLAIAAMVGVIVIFVGIVTMLAVTVASGVVGSGGTDSPTVVPSEKKASGASSAGSTAPRSKGETGSASSPKPI
jgi:hypothetical protein